MGNCRVLVIFSGFNPPQLCQIGDQGNKKAVTTQVCNGLYSTCGPLVPQNTYLTKP